MKANKLSTIFLILLLVFTVTIAAGCDKDQNEKDPEQVETPNNSEEENNNEEEKNNQEEPKEETKKTVKLLKRNGVEWKENTSINSSVGAEKYTVVWGDTLSLIARTWNVNCYTLARYNGIENIDLIEVGQVIYNYTYKG